MDDDTHKGDSDSDWDSTLDFTSHRQAGVPVGQFRPKGHDEIEEESALSGESDLDVDEDLPIDQHVINNVLKPTDDRQRAPSPNQKENNIVLAQKQRQQQQQQMREQPANQSVQQQQQQQQQQQRGTPEPPYNFREALTDNRHSPVPKEREAPGKNRKGTTYDPAPSPTPRGIIKNQGSIKSVGSWDDSDPDEKTLREIRTKYRTEKQREELKNKEDESVIEEAPQTARSETTWKSWTGKFGKKKKGSKNNDQSQASVAAGTPRTRDSVQTARSDVHSNVHSNVQSNVHSNVQHSNVHSGNIPRLDVTSPSMIQVQDQRYSTTPNVLQVPQTAPVQYVQKHAPVQYVQNPVNDVPMTTVDTMLGDEPRKLFVKDDDAGRYVYYFGHGNLRYFEVNEDLEEATLPPIADKVDQVVQRVWQEVFAVLRIVFSIVIWFIVELFRFLAKHIFQPLIVGIVVTVGDYIVKPFLSAMFNGIVQPGSIFCWNMFSGMRHMFTPVGEILQRILEQFAMLFRSIRLFEINYMTGQTPIVQTV